MTDFTADWVPVGDVYYRKFELHKLKWPSWIEASKVNGVGANFGGPLAIWRKKDTAVNSLQELIGIYSASGKEIGKILWQGGDIVAIGWTSQVEICAVQRDGSVSVYDVSGKFKTSLNMGNDAREKGVISAKFFISQQGTGVAVMTAAYRIYLTNTVDTKATVRRLGELVGVRSMPPSCWSLLVRDKQTLGIVARDSDVYILDSSGTCIQQATPVTTSRIERLAVAFNYKYVAIQYESGLVRIVAASDFTLTVAEVDLRSTPRVSVISDESLELPTDMFWCGSNALVLRFSSSLFLVNTQRQTTEFLLVDTPICVVVEMDGVRLIGEMSHEFLQKVPNVSEEIFRIGSTAPGAVLLEAFRAYLDKERKADEYMRTIRDQLEQAIQQCVDAAKHEFNVQAQQSLLKAANFGRCFLPANVDMSTEDLCTTCKLLRVLNMLRNDSAAIPLSFAQLKQLTVPVLIDQILIRKHYPLARAICDYLQLPPADGIERVMLSWALYRIEQRQKSDELVAQDLIEKLSGSDVQMASTGASRFGPQYACSTIYTEIANRAIDLERIDLGVRLLDCEPRASKQVRLLMKANRSQLALQKAIASGDSDLVYFVLLHLKETLSGSEFLGVIRNSPVAFTLYLQYAREALPATLLDIYYQIDNYAEQAVLFVKEAADRTATDEKLAQLQRASAAFRKAKLEWYDQQTEDYMKLLRFQQRAEEEFQKPYINLTVSDTLRQLITDGNVKSAEQFRKEFRVSDVRYYAVKIRALASRGEWDELEKFARSKKSPVGYEPFFDICLKNDRKDVAETFVARVEPEKRVKCLVKLGKLEEAVEVATQNKSERDLNYIIAATKNKSLQERIAQIRSSLKH